MKYVSKPGRKKDVLEPYQHRRFVTMAKEGYEPMFIAESFGRGDNWVRYYAARHRIQFMDERSRKTREGMARARALKHQENRA